MNRICCFLLVAFVAGCAPAVSDDRGTLSDADRRAIHALDSTYVGGWLRGDSTVVLGTLTPDAVLLPAGRRPLVGLDSIRNYWWPKDGSRTDILAFVSRIEEIEGDGNLAYLRGIDSISFTYTRDTVTTTSTNLAITLAVLTRSSTGQWRIARKMWGTYVR